MVCMTWAAKDMAHYAPIPSSYTRRVFDLLSTAACGVEDFNDAPVETDFIEHENECQSACRPGSVVAYRGDAGAFFVGGRACS